MKNVISTMVLAAALAVCSDAEADDIASQLAMLDGGGSSLARKFDSELDQMADLCPESKRRIGELASGGQEILRDRGLDDSILGVLVAWRAIVSSVNRERRESCAPLLQAYLIKRLDL